MRKAFRGTVERVGVALSGLLGVGVGIFFIRVGTGLEEVIGGVVPMVLIFFGAVLILSSLLYVGITLDRIGVGE